MVQPAFLLAVQNFRIQQEAEGAYVTSPSTDPWHRVPDELPRKDSISHSSSQLTAGGTKRVLGESMGKGSWTPSLVPVGCTPGTTSLCWLCILQFSLVQFSSVAQSCPTLCNPMDCNTPGLPVHHQLLEFTQTHVHWVGDAIQPSHPLSSPSPGFNLSQHQGLLQGVSSLYQVAKVLEFQLQHQFFQWILKTDFL